MSAELKNLSTIDYLPKPHLNYLWSLKAAGFEPKVIYDIGSCVLHWTRHAKQIWPHAKIILFDAFQPAEFLYAGYDYNIGVLSNEDDREVKFFQNDIYPGGNSYYREIGSFLSPGIFPDDGFVMKKTMKLDTVVKNRGFPPPDFVKIDVQGAELDVLEGGKLTLASAKHMVVELQHTQFNEGAKLIAESIPIVEKYGWICTAPLLHDNYVDGDYGFSRPNYILQPNTQLGSVMKGLKWLKKR